MLQLWSKKMLSTLYYTFKIIPTPADAVVTINGENVNSVTLMDGSEISWSVSAKDHEEQTGTLTLNEDTVVDVVLEEKKGPISSDTITINAPSGGGMISRGDTFRYNLSTSYTYRFTVQSFTTKLYGLYGSNSYGISGGETIMPNKGWSADGVMLWYDVGEPVVFTPSYNHSILEYIHPVKQSGTIVLLIEKFEKGTI
jgi:hypothetical protein